MNDDPKFLLVNHTIINTRLVTHMIYRDSEPHKMNVYFATGKVLRYEGEPAKLLWQHMQGDTDLEIVAKNQPNP